METKSNRKYKIILPIKNSEKRPNIWNEIIPQGNGQSRPFIGPKPDNCGKVLLKSKDTAVHNARGEKHCIPTINTNFECTHTLLKGFLFPDWVVMCAYRCDVTAFSFCFNYITNRVLSSELSIWISLHILAKRNIRSRVENSKSKCAKYDLIRL